MANLRVFPNFSRMGVPVRAVLCMGGTATAGGRRPATTTTVTAIQCKVCRRLPIHHHPTGLASGQLLFDVWTHDVDKARPLREQTCMLHLYLLAETFVDRSRCIRCNRRVTIDRMLPVVLPGTLQSMLSVAELSTGLVEEDQWTGMLMVPWYLPCSWCGEYGREEIEGMSHVANPRWPHQLGVEFVDACQMCWDFRSSNSASAGTARSCSPSPDAPTKTDAPPC